MVHMCRATYNVMNCLFWSVLLLRLSHSQALSEIEDGDLVEEERQRKAAVRKSKMESGLTMEDEEQLEKKAVRGGKGRRRIYCRPGFDCVLNNWERRQCVCSFVSLKIPHYFLF